MNQFYLSGSSSGIGSALLPKLCELGKVVGLSRSNHYSHPNFTFHTIDLSEPILQTAAFQFSVPKECTQAVLINNAGLIGDIRRVGELDAAHFAKVINVNLTSLAILCNRFIAEVEQVKCSGLILNISSGAATHPIASWATYCASKAGVDLFSATINDEMMKKGNSRIKCFSIYPGIVDTSMQEHIRASNSTDFPEKIRFEEYKNTGQLADPDLVADKIIAIFKDYKNHQDTIINLREH